MSLYSVRASFITSVLLMGSILFLSNDGQSQAPGFKAQDPGMRLDGGAAGAMLPGLTPIQQQAFAISRETFQDVASV